MSDNVFQFRHGLAEIFRFYFSLDKEHKSAEDLRNSRCETIISHGRDSVLDPVYVHLHIKDLFTTTKLDLNSRMNAARHMPNLNAQQMEALRNQSEKTSYTIPRGTSIEIDFFTVPQYAIRAVGDLSLKNNLDHIKGLIKHIHTSKLQLTNRPNGCIKPDTENKSVIENVPEDKKSLWVNRYMIREGEPSDDIFDLAFQLHFPDDVTESLLDNNFENDMIFAWAWVISPGWSNPQYQKCFGDDFNINSFSDRINILKNPDGTVGNNIINGLKGLVAMDRTYTRNDIDRFRNGSSDGFPLDEPTSNFLEVRNTLPFTSFMANTQIGPTGIIKHSKRYFDKYYHGNRRKYIVDNIESVKVKLDCDDNFRSTFAQSHHLAEHGVISNGNEYSSRADNYFFYREKSVPLWLNSLESHFDYRPLNSVPGLYTKGNYEFEFGEIELIGHDFVKEYEHIHDLRLMGSYNPAKAYHEQRTIDLKEFDTITIHESIEAELDKSVSGDNADQQHKIQMGRGIGGNNDFIGIYHSKCSIYHDRSEKSKIWEAHRFSQRPVILTYSLSRDLETDEIDTLRDNPIIVSIHYNNERPTYFDFALNLDFGTEIGKAGDHAIILYMQLDGFDAHLAIISQHLNTNNGNVPSDRNSNGGHFFRSLKLNSEKIEKIKISEPESDGLFIENPVIAIDDFQLTDVKDAKLKAKLDKYRSDLTKECGKFILGFVPKVGGVASAVWPVAVDLINSQKITSEQKLEVGQKALSLILTSALDQNDAVGAFATSSSENVLGTLAFALKISNLVETLKADTGKITSPFILDQSFGESFTFNDSLYLISTKDTEFSYNDSSMFFDKGQPANKQLSVFCNRNMVTRDSSFPFDIQFGDNGGTLLRTFSESRDIKDSLSIYRLDYLQKKSVMKELLIPSNNISSQEYLRLLANSAHLLDICTKSKVNAGLKNFIVNEDVSGVFQKFLSNGSTLTENEVIKLTAVQNLFKYIETSFTMCPSCGEIMSASWGWCPYHATPADMSVWGVVDGNGDNDLNAEFLQSDNVKKTIVQVLGSPHNDPNNPDMRAYRRELVHWTEFIIMK